MRESSSIGDQALARARQFVELLNHGTADDIRRAVRRSFASTAITPPESAGPDESVMSGGWAVRLARTLRGIEITAAEATERGAHLQAAERYPLASGSAEIDCRVEATPPHLITQWSYRPLEITDRSAAPDDAWRTVEAVLNDLAEADLFSGAVLLQNGGRRLLAARGLADHVHAEPNDANTRFNIASVTKLVTAVAVCQLVERGIVDLQAPIAEWLGADVDHAIGRLTAHQLLLHIAGLPEQMPEPDASGSASDGSLAPIRGVGLDFEPGSRWQYSNVGYAVLGAVLERAVGTRYIDAMSSMVFQPAGMSATGFEDTSVATRGRAVGYQYASDAALAPTVPNLDSGLGRGAAYGYATSTVEDIERLIVAIIDHRLVGGSMADRILSGSQATDTPTRMAGYGLFRDRVNDRRITSSAGAGPGISAWVDVVPELGYRAIVLSNHPKPAAHRVGRFLRSRLLADDLHLAR